MSGLEVSVCIVSRRREALLGRCLESLAVQRDVLAWELLVAADDDPGVEATVTASSVADGATVLHTSGLSLAANRNLLVGKASGSLLVFLDDDVVVGRSFLADVVGLARARPEVAVFGGPNLTPSGASRRAVVQGRLLADRWLTGPIAARYRPLEGERSTSGGGLTLCNLVVRADAAPSFPPHQRGGEENVMLSDLRRRGHQMVRHRAVAVEHERRATVGSFARQVHKYGFGRGEALVASHLIATVLAGIAATAMMRPRRLAAAGAIAAGAIGASAWRASPDGDHRPEDVAQAASLPMGYVAGVVHGAGAALMARLRGPTRADSSPVNRAGPRSDQRAPQHASRPRSARKALERVVHDVAVANDPGGGF